MTEFGEYLVIGKRRYRGHEPGTTFEARLDRNAEARALLRGDIRLLRRYKPSVTEVPFTISQEWLSEPSRTTQPSEGG